MKSKSILLLSLAALAASVTDALASSPVMIGRRGCGYAIENTTEAYREGASRGFTIMEAHVRLTSDSIFVTSHDGKTARLGGRFNVAKAPLDSLMSETYLQKRERGSYTGGTICTVGEFLDICSQTGTAPLLHLKKLNKDSKDCAFLTPLVRLVKQKGLADKCTILTSEPDYIDYLMAKHPDMKLQFQADAK